MLQNFLKMEFMMGKVNGVITDTWGKFEKAGVAGLGIMGGVASGSFFTAGLSAIGLSLAHDGAVKIRNFVEGKLTRDAFVDKVFIAAPLLVGSIITIVTLSDLYYAEKHGFPDLYPPLVAVGMTLITTSIINSPKIRDAICFYLGWKAKSTLENLKDKGKEICVIQ